MEEKQKLRPFIFYLTLDEKLPDHFFRFDQACRDQGFVLVPIKWDQLQVLRSSSDQSHLIVICSVITSRERKNYQDHIVPILKTVLKAERFHYFLFSGFAQIDQTVQFVHQKNYFFIKLPISISKSIKKIALYYEYKKSTKQTWPGGRRTRLPQLGS